MQPPRKKLRASAVFLIIIWIVLFGASLFLLQFLLSFLNTQQSQSVANLNWAGYLVNSNAGNPQPEIVRVTASWVVPKVTFSNSDSYSSAWVGIGGQFDRSLIQAGTEHDYVNGNEFYFVWYELLPDKAVRVTEMDISPGDSITASISLANADKNEWSIHVFDLTNGRTFVQDFFYNSSMLSAEWIVERPTVNDQYTHLVNFGTVTFTNAHVATKDNSGAISKFPLYRLSITSKQNVELTSVSPLSSDGSSFTITYLRDG